MKTRGNGPRQALFGEMWACLKVHLHNNGNNISKRGRPDEASRAARYRWRLILPKF